MEPIPQEDPRWTLALTGLRQSIESFLTDPPDTDYQAGYLAGLLVIYHDHFGMPQTDPLMVAGNRALETHR